MATKTKVTTTSKRVPIQVTMNTHAENPFYGMKHCLTLYQEGGKGVINDLLLDACWEEVKNDIEKRKLFYTLLFSIGDITGRHHNIFGKQKTDSGGNAQREAFRAVVQWMKLRPLQYEQFKTFLFAGLFNEYSCFDTILANRVKTTKKTKKVAKVFNMLTGSKEFVNMLADYCAAIIKGNNPAAKYFLAKFLTRPTLSKRKKHKMMLPETIKVMRQREFFLKIVSQKAGLRYLKKETHTEFHGYIEWRKAYNGELESVLFASKKILEFDKIQFLSWLDKLPSSARHRVRVRLLNKDNTTKGVTVKDSKTEVKWGEMPAWFLQWEQFKTKKQTEQRNLEETIRQSGGATEEQKTQLAKVKKEAKVTTGAVDFAGMFVEIIKGTIDPLKIQPFLDKINLPYNTLVFMDDSGSMGQASYGGFTAFDFATFIATVCLTKNPDDSGRSLLSMYSNRCRMFGHIDVTVDDIRNSILRSNSAKVVNEPFIKPELHFLENLMRIRKFAFANRTPNGTNLASIPDNIYSWIAGDLTKLEQLQAFPVWTIITDGNWNQMGSPEASLNDFFMKCERYFGFKPYIIAIDVSGSSSASIYRFQGISNFMYIPPNPAQIEQLLTNFRDMDIMDVYTPLQSLYRSNRYDLVKAHTL